MAHTVYTEVDFDRRVSIRVYICIAQTNLPREDAHNKSTVH